MAKQIELGTLEIIAKQTMARLGLKNVQVNVMWNETQGAVTNGNSWIRISKEWYGKDLSIRTKTNMTILTGLIQHEIIHWLQDLQAIAEASRSVNFSAFADNIICDIQGERSIIAALGNHACKALFTLRALVRKNKLESYKEAIDGDPKLADYQAIMLFGRFRSTRNPYRYTKRGSAKSTRGIQLSHHLFTTMPKQSDQLPDYMKATAAAFPELCNGDQPNKMFPTISSCTLNPEQLGCARAVVLAKTQTHYVDLPRGQIIPKAIRLSSQIRLRLDKTPTVKTIKSVGTINRRDLATDQDVPFDYTVNTEESIGRSVIICVDRSGSMLCADNHNLYKAIPKSVKVIKTKTGAEYYKLPKLDYVDDNMSKSLTVAQAFSMAIKAEQGEVIGVLFGDDAWLSSGMDKSAILFPSHAHDICLGGTSFVWLTWLWQKYPNHQVIVITDGDGDQPDKASKADREKTTFIQLTDDANNVFDFSKIAQNHIVCSDISQLPKLILELVN